MENFKKEYEGCQERVFVENYFDTISECSLCLYNSNSQIRKCRKRLRHKTILIQKFGCDRKGAVKVKYLRLRSSRRLLAEFKQTSLSDSLSSQGEKSNKGILVSQQACQTLNNHSSRTMSDQN